MSSSKENSDPDSASTKSYEDHASFISDSIAVGETNVEPAHVTDKIWLPRQTEGLDTYSTHPDITVIQGATSPLPIPHFSNPHFLGPGHPSIQMPRPRHGNVSKVSHWLATQPVTSHLTPTTVKAISCATTERSALPLGAEAAMLWSHEPSQSSRRKKAPERLRRVVSLKQF